MGAYPSSFLALVPWLLSSATGNTFTSRIQAPPTVLEWNALESQESSYAREVVTGVYECAQYLPMETSTMSIHATKNIPRGGGDSIIGSDDLTNNTKGESELKPEGQPAVKHENFEQERSKHAARRRRNPIRKIGRLPLLLPKRWINVAKNMVGRTAGVILSRPSPTHHPLDTSDEIAVDHSFDELDKIIESTNTTSTTADEPSEKARLQQQILPTEEEMDDLLKTTWPPFQQAASLLKWRKQRSFSSWINEMGMKFLSAETANALGTIRDIIDTFSDYGVVDLMGMYSSKDVIRSIVALSRLQHIVLESSDSKTSRNDDANNGNTTIDKQFIQELAHYCTFANAAYGWKGFAFCGRWHVLGGNNRILVRSTGIGRHDIVDTNWHSKANRPAYYIARDMNRKAIVLSIRGSMSPRDILTDLCASSENFIVEDDQEIGFIGEGKYDDVSTATMSTPPIRVGRAHRGMVDAARSVARMTGKKISDELEAHPNFSLVIVGHSLGGGVAAVLYYMWQRRFLNRVRSIGYGSPCVFPLNMTRGSDESNITTIMGIGDPFATISLGHIADVTKALSKLCQDKGLREEVLKRTGTRLLKYDLKDMTRDDIDWCTNAMTFLRKQMDSEKLLPPGKIFQMSGHLLDFQLPEGNNNGWAGSETTATLKSADAMLFNELKLHARMLDVSRHIPVRYEMLLKRLAAPSDV